MFNFGSANKNQKVAICATDGPVLITAGPGTGKTFTLVKRAVYLVSEKRVQPEQILIATFTEKAAKELVTRITNELAGAGLEVNINEMYIGTFHSICLRILKEHLEYTRLRKNYHVLDQFDQRYMIFQNIHYFRAVPHVDSLFKSTGAWKQAGEIAAYVDRLSEELVESAPLLADRDPLINAVGGILQTYRRLLLERNLMDFASIQTETFRLLSEKPDILSQISEKIRYIMIDEYQDTNFVQEQLVMLLGKAHRNICVVGDDDQGLYRFRGATIRNIIEFQAQFPQGDCKVVPLVVNYRSNSDIVDFYNRWMNTTEGSGFKFTWGKFRLGKNIVPHEKSENRCPAVAKIYAVDDEETWYERILRFIQTLRGEGRLTDYNQIAFLFNSVRNPRVRKLANFLEENGINVYSPRSDMYFEREEVRLLIGTLILMFPDYADRLQKGKHEYLSKAHFDYYMECANLAKGEILKPKNKDLLRFVRQKAKYHDSLTDNTDYGYTGLVYQLFEFPLFHKNLDMDLSCGIIDVRPARNTALFTQILSKYEYLHRIDVLSGKESHGIRGIDADTEKLFNLFLRLLYDGGITEYEDDSEYAPSGCVSFLTIHQAKGMEFPIVFVGSLERSPTKSYTELMAGIEEKYFKRDPFEPYEDIKYFDFWRHYYTAFSRAQNLLLLTCAESTVGKRAPSKYFRDIYDELPDARKLDTSFMQFAAVKDVNLKDTFSFTSHITVYETCSLQYKFYRELEFTPVRASAMVFGMLVHQTIEDVHRAALRKEEHLINPDNIEAWFEANYSSITRAERVFLAPPQKQAALKQVKKYAKRQAGEWDRVQQVEVDVSLVKPEYIIKGTIDLIKGEGGTVELVDFKGEKKPDIFNQAEKERIELYRRQLNVYAHLVEERTGQKVSKMNLYYTGTEDGNPVISYPYSQTAIDSTILAFDDTVQKILKKDFGKKSKNPKTCNGCDFRHYCGSK